MTTNAQTSKTPNTPTQQLKPKSQSTTPVSIEKQTSARKYTKKASHPSASQSDLFNTNKHLVNQASNLLGNVMNSYEQTTLALSSTSKPNQTPMDVRQANACLPFNENMDNLKSLLSTNSANTNMVPNSNRLSRSPDELNFSANKLNLNHSSSMLVKHHPRPSAVTSFNARLTDNGGGYTLWNRRQDNLRCVLTNAFNSSELFSKSSRNYTMPNNEFMQTQEHYMIEQNQNDDFNSTHQTTHSYSNGFDYNYATTNTNGSSNGHKQFFSGIDQFLSPKLVNYPYVNHSNAYHNNHVNSHNEDNIGNNNGNMFLNDHGVHYTSDSFINNEFINASSLSLAPAATTTSTNSSCMSSTNNLVANQPMFNNHTTNTNMNNGNYHLNGTTSPTTKHMNLKRPYSASTQLSNSHVSHMFVDDEYGNSYKYMKLTPSSSPIKSNLSPPTNHNHENHHAMSHHHHHNHLFNHANANQPTHLKKFSFSLISSSPSSSSSASSSISSLLASTNNLANNIALNNNSATNGANNQNNLLASKNV